MAVKRVIDVLKLEPITNPTPANGDVWRDIADGELKYHNDNATYNFLTNAATSGGTYYKLSSDFTNTDATSTPENVTGMAFAVEANRTYAVDGVFIMADVAAASAGCLSLSLPSGASFIGHQIQPRPGNFTVSSAPWTESYASGVGSAQAGEVTNYDSNGLYGVPITFSLVLSTSSTAGTVQLVLTNRAGDGTEQGLRKGTFIRVQA